MPRKPRRADPAAPRLGPLRHIIMLPPGVGRALAFEGEGVELSNGWCDLSARIALADPDDWLPPIAWSLDSAAITPIRRYGDGEPQQFYPDEVLCDGTRHPFREVLTGTLARNRETVECNLPAYWLYAAGAWRIVHSVEPPPPEPDAEPVEQISTD